ncbi:60S ribosomal protein L11 [Lemmus lemmus]
MTTLHCTVGPVQIESWQSSKVLTMSYENNFPDARNVRFGVQECANLGINYQLRFNQAGLDFSMVLGRPGFSCTDGSTGQTAVESDSEPAKRPRAGSHRSMRSYASGE